MPPLPCQWIGSYYQEQLVRNGFLVTKSSCCCGKSGGWFRNETLHTANFCLHLNVTFHSFPIFFHQINCYHLNEENDNHDNHLAISILLLYFSFLTSSLIWQVLTLQITVILFKIKNFTNQLFQGLKFTHSFYHYLPFYYSSFFTWSISTHSIILIMNWKEKEKTKKWKSKFNSFKQWYFSHYSNYYTFKGHHH